MQGPPEAKKTTLTESHAVVVLKVEAAETELQQELQRFWCLESMPIAKDSFNAAGDEEYKQRQEFEQKIVQRNGRYKVNFPCKQSVNLENNRENAMKRLLQLTKRLTKNEGKLRCYDQAISEYTRMGTAGVQESSEAPTTLCCYMPHQAVIREDRGKTKVRVVCDASSHAGKGMSLNDDVEARPDLNEYMLSLLINLRKEKVVLVGGVEKALLQIVRVARIGIL